jgi:histone deacetylase 6
MRQRPVSAEPPERIRMAIRDVNLLLAAMKYIPVRPVNEDDTLLVHLKNIGSRDKVPAIQCKLWFLNHVRTRVSRIRYIAYLENSPAPSVMTQSEVIESETCYSCMFMSGTAQAAHLSCGGSVIEACFAVVRGELKKTFAIVQPLGHHVLSITVASHWAWILFACCHAAILSLFRLGLRSPCEVR